MEEFRKLLEAEGIYPKWVGIPGKSLRSIGPTSFNKVLKKLEEIL